MKKIYFLLIALSITTLSFSQTVFINEIHYDNASTDIDEGVEIAGPAGTDLSTYTLTFYNGSNGSSYDTETLTGTIPNEGGSGYGAIFFPVSGLQNGAPDGIALDNNGSLIQFLSYEGSLTGSGGPADGVASTDIGVSETSSTPSGQSLQLTGTGTTYAAFIWSAPMTASPNAINSGQTFGAGSPTVVITTPSDNTEFSPGTTSVDIEWSTANLGGGETVDITVNGNKSTNVTSPFNIATSNGQTYNILVELVDGGVLDSDSSSFSVASITQVNNIAALKADVDTNGEGGFYEILSTPTITYARASRNQKYIQDATGGILIDDSSGTITTPFSVGDGMSGLTGTASFYNGVLQFVPIQDASVATGATITPEVVTIANLLANVDNYESKLVRINAVSFTEAGGTFATSTDYTINDASSRGGSSMTFRTNFSEADYIGQTIPSGNVNMEVLVGEFNGTPQVTGIDMAGITLSTKENQIEGFGLYPNPTKEAFVNITSDKHSPMKVRVYDILGKQVIQQTVTNNRLNVSHLNTGVYILRAEQDHAFTTRKLVIN